MKNVLYEIPYTKLLGEKLLNETINNIPKDNIYGSYLFDAIDEYKKSKLDNDFGDIIYCIILDWVQSSLPIHMRPILWKRFDSILPCLQKLRNTEYSKIFTPKSGKVYRGTYVTKEDIIEFVKKVNSSNLKYVNIKNDKYVLYNKTFAYKPKQIYQSWTTEDSIAYTFNSGTILLTQIKSDSNNFYFNSNFLNSFATYADLDPEYEVIHRGDNLDVYLLIRKQIFDTI